MKIITFGRSNTNDVVVKDDMVSREFHMKLIITDDGRYKVVDNSTNGTFVNGKKVPGEMFINKGDLIRIGNTMVAWENYINTPTIYNPGPINNGPSSVTPLPNETNGMAIAGFVCSFFGWVAILGVVFSAIGLSRANKSITRKGRGLAIAGLAISITSIVLNIILASIGFGVMASVLDL